jgi:outer membrane protein TolC
MMTPLGRLFCCAVCLLFLGAGCRGSHTVRDPEFVPLARRPLVEHATIQTVSAAEMPTHPEFEGAHSVDEYVAYALSQNPRIQAQRKLVEASALRVPQAASLQDPEVGVMGWPFYPNVPQTASGRMTADLVVSQKVPWFGKLDARAEMARAEADAARAQLAATEWEIIEQVKRAYFELYYIQQSIAITEKSRQLAVDISRIAEAMYRTATVSQQDLLRSQVEVSNIDGELVRLRQELKSSQARLARLLHISPDTSVRALDGLPSDDIPNDLQALYDQAIAARPELHMELANMRKERVATDLARLQYYPDVTLSFGWGGMTTEKAIAPTADGIDNLGVGAMINVPIYYRRLEAGVREGEARTVMKAREYDNLRDQTQEEVKDLFVRAQSEQELLRLFELEIIPKAQQTLNVSISAYEVKQIDLLTLIDNWRNLLRYQVAEVRLRAQLRQTVASLERVVAGLPAPPAERGISPVPPVPDESAPSSPQPDDFPQPRRDAG